MKRLLPTLIFGLACGTFIGIMIEYHHPSPGSDRWLYKGQTKRGCFKCGAADVKLRYCNEKCKTLTATPGGETLGGPVVWGYDHLHRACAICGFDRDAIECRDVFERQKE